jgi:HEAT repeat protein
MSNDPYVASLLEDLFSRDSELQDNAILALGEVGEAAAGAVPDLARALQDSNKKFFAALALGGIGPAASDAVPALMEALEDYNIVVRWSAANSLGDIGPAAAGATSALVAAVGDLHACARCFFGSERKGITAEDVRIAAVRALRRLELTDDALASKLRELGADAFGPLAQEIEQTVIVLEHGAS